MSRATGAFAKEEINVFGKLMNSYYYGKSGKGDYRKEDLPTNRWQLFWEMLRVRLSGLMRLNLLYMICWLPAMLVLMLSGISLLTGLNQFVDPEAAAAAVTVISADSVQGTDLADPVHCHHRPCYGGSVLCDP